MTRMKQLMADGTEVKTRERGERAKMMKAARQNIDAQQDDETTQEETEKICLACLAPEHGVDKKTWLARTGQQSQVIALCGFES